jgi:lysophospholipase L1-like esterase
MIRLAFAAGFAFILATSPATATEPTFGSERCAVPHEVGELGAHFPGVRDRLRDNQPLRIVALGSSSTAGAGATTASATYPSVLEEELRRLWPGKDISVLNYGIGGHRASDMVRRIIHEVVAERPALVIWQTGVNDAIRDVGVPVFRRLVDKGLRKLHEAGIEVILLDQQPLRDQQRFPRYGSYIDELHDSAWTAEVGLFRRSDVMRHWIESGALTPAEVLGLDGLHMVDTSYRCLASVLADSLAAAVADTPESAQAPRAETQALR